MDFNLVQQSYWDTQYKDFKLRILPKDNQLRQWIEEFFKEGQGSCFEVGCFPGGYLAVFGDLGYNLNGIDLTPRVETDLPEWLKTQGYKVGKFHKGDFLNYDNKGIKYDIVCSFGFIEHFNNWERILVKQAHLVKDGGYLVVSAPNFRGFFQRMIHFIFDKENYERHYIPSMNPKMWAIETEKLDFETKYSGYFGSFDFWLDKPERNVFRKILLKGLRCLSPVLKRLPKDQMAYSPYCGLIAQKSIQKKDDPL